MPTTENSNSYDNDDLLAVVQEIEGFIAAETEIKQAAKATRQGEVKKAKNRAKELGIPNDILTAVLKERDLDRRTHEAREKIIGKVKEEHLELFEDSSGQMSWLEPDPDSKELTSTQKAVDRRRAEIQARTDDEREEGAQILDDFIGGHDD